MFPYNSRVMMVQPVRTHQVDHKSYFFGNEAATELGALNLLTDMDASFPDIDAVQVSIDGCVAVKAQPNQVSGVVTAKNTSVGAEVAPWNKMMTAQLPRSTAKTAKRDFNHLSASARSLAAAPSFTFHS